MRAVPERPAIQNLFALLGAFIAGPLMGSTLGTHLTPDSELAQIVTVLAFPTAFVAGLLFWLGFGVIAVVVGALANLVRGRIPSVGELDTHETIVPPGYGSFVIFSIGLATVAGLLAAMLSSASLTGALSAHTATGAAYGIALWWLAHHGYLPFPEPE